MSIAARREWDRHAERIHSEGRWQIVDHDQLATYVETVDLYLKCKEQIDTHGVLVQGRTQHELVRNPALTPLNKARADSAGQGGSVGGSQTGSGRRRVGRVH